MGSRDDSRGGDPDPAVPAYAPANERVAKLVALLGSYLIWIALVASVGAMALFAF